MPNLIDHLVFRAKVVPKSVAIQRLHSQLNFQELLLRVKKIANKLRQSGIKPGQTVVTAIPGKGRDWLVSLALFHEATVTCSYHGQSPIDAFEYDWMITDRKVDPFESKKTIRMDNAWLEDAQKLSGDIELIDYDSPDSQVRLALTSGTLGRSRAVSQSYGQIISRVENSIAHYGTASCFNLMAMSTAGGFSSMVVALVTGHPIYPATTPKDVIQMAETFPVESLYGSPVQLAHLVDELAARGKKLPNLKMVRYAGGAASRKLLGNIETYLSGNIINLYGSTEAGGICTFRPTSRTDSSIAGYPYVGVEVEIVDESGAVLAHGLEGSIRLKTPYMVHAYHGDPAATEQSFKDGWFYPGDRGTQKDDGLLVIAGRDGELINRGGVKIDPASIDQFLAGYKGVADAAVFGFEDNAGVSSIAAAIKAPEGFDLEELKEESLRKLGSVRCPSVFFKVKQIPRNQMGKVVRGDLKRILATRMARSSKA